MQDRKISHTHRPTQQHHFTMPYPLFKTSTPVAPTSSTQSNNNSKNNVKTKSKQAQHSQKQSQNRSKRKSTSKKSNSDSSKRSTHNDGKRNSASNTNEKDDEDDGNEMDDKECYSDPTDNMEEAMMTTATSTDTETLHRNANMEAVLKMVTLDVHQQPPDAEQLFHLMFRTEELPKTKRRKDRDRAWNDREQMEVDAGQRQRNI